MNLIKSYLFLLSFLFIFFPSCFPYDNGGGGCGQNIECESDSQCIEEYGENFICFDEKRNYNNYSLIKTNKLSCAGPEAYCVEDICKNLELDCGDGECSLRASYGNGPAFAECICNKNANYAKYMEQNAYTIQKCLIDYSCENSNDCLGVAKKINNEFHSVNVCTPDGLCVKGCSSNLDCKGDKEVCLSSGDTCLDITTIECKENTYNDPYKEGRCSSFCNETTNSCKLGFKCSNEEKCVPTCINNDDCLKDKFTGDTCNTELNYCE